MVAKAKLSVFSREEAVARIAYHCSDIVYSVQPNLTNSGPFSPTLNHLYSTKTPSTLTGQITQVVPVRYNADPFLAPLRSVRLGQVASVITAAESLLLAIPLLSVLSSYAVVIHVTLPSGPFADFSTISALRQTGFAMVQSTTLQEVQDMALIAHCIAISSGKGVIHFTEAAQNDSPIATENLSVIQSLLQSQKPAPKKSYQSFSKTIYRRDLEQETASEGTVELSHTNGANGANSSNGDSPQNEVTNGHTSSTNGIAVNGNEVAVSPVSSTSSGHGDDDSESNHFSCRISEKLFSLLYNLTGRDYHNFEYYGPSSAHSAIVLFGSYAEEMKKALAQAQPSDAYSGMGLVLIRVYRPWQGTAFLTSLATDLRRIAVVEQLRHRPTKWGPVFMDVLASVRERDAGSVAVVSYQLGHIHQGSVNSALTQIATNLLLDNPQQNIAIGQPLIAPANNKLEQPHIENSYIKMLRQLFADKLSVINSADVTSPVVATEISSSPEYLFGFYVSRSEMRKRLVSEISAAARAGQLGKGNLTESILHWIDQSASGLSLSEPALQELLDALRQQGSSIAKEVVANPWIFKSEVPWIIGSEAWAYDLGTSAVHHALSSGSNINLLIIDSQPFSQKNESAAESRKKDIGLYAMNFGNAYVASVALYSSYTQVMHAMVEAQQFNGPSIVLAYLPYTSETDSPLQVLQDTKLAVDSGYWPLYRWTPASAQGAEPIFQLDSERVKKELKAFIDRENHLTHLVRGNVDLSPVVSHSHGSELKRLRKSKAKQAMDRLMDGLSGPPVSILFGSDGGNAENLAKRLGRRCKARGLKPKTLAMDDFPVEELPNEGNVIFLTSTAGQGEFPQNGRETWDALKNSTDIDLSRVRYTVFALGDSHYWPRKEDKLYYNKPGKDLDARLEALGAKKLVPIGLGDDQDPDGYETGYSAWEPQLWKAFGVDKIDVDFEEPKPLTNEDIKIASNFLRGTIAEGLADTSTGAISESDAQLTKFHGTYMQDDRDLREERKSQGLEPAYSFMVRVRMSGGVCQPEQWIAMDEISDKWGNETFKLTTRQTFQFHGILKTNLRTAIRGINSALLTTIGACGDVNRNVMCSSLPTRSKLHAEVYAASKAISNRFLPSTSAYHEIWLRDSDGKNTQVAGDAVQDFEPLYGPTYLPRKFKITIAVPPVNDTDVYAHDIGLIAIKDEASSGLAGFNVLVGGGMGMTHGSKKTYARLGQPLGFCLPREVSDVAEAVILVQRDNGDRTNRKHARLKYTIDDMGLDEFKRQVGERLGRQLLPPRDHEAFTTNVDDFSGWLKGDDGLYSHTIFIENGRVENRTELQAKSGLLEIARYMQETKSGHFRLTGNQHVILAGITSEHLPRIKDVLAKYKLDNLNFSGLRLSSSACVAFPTWCGLAMAESERYLPTLITKLEDTILEAGLRNASIVMRMTGCPNGCARPWVAELACVGKAPGTYNLMLGGGYHGQRLNKLYRSSVNEQEILEILKPMIKQYALERHDEEHFGDWVIRAGYITAVERGGQHGAMHEGVPEEDD